MPKGDLHVDEVFDAAIRRASEEDRAAYLDEVCGADSDLRQRVERLLRAFAEAGSFLDSPAPDPPPTVDQPVTEAPGTQIGPYRLLQQIGEGGMGVVYMAEQTEPVERRVALKIIKPGMDTRQVIARFEAEEQALAMMDHPNIAKVLDAGTTESGRPYFVMELVKGIPITAYCDQQHLTPKERLQLFIPICQAVQHAHQKGIIHRDLKPNNILIALYDGQPVPKVIDFGVAKATSQKLTEKTMFTQYGQVVGTVEYMSPEQANLNQLDIDTRSDIYSLGVLLYELLTGATPFDRARLRSAAFEEMLRIIREEEPPKPSTRLSTIDTLPSVAANRHIEPKKLSALVRGELDWIVMKALEKDRTRRYETAKGFADDIQHYLSDESVVACPPSAAYRLRKFARRNMAAVVTTSIVVGALAVGVAGITWQAIRATKQRDRAVAAEARATTEAAIARAVNEFLNQDLLSQANPDREPDRDIKLRTVVDRAAEKVEGRFVDQPAVEAAARTTLGNTYRSLGEYGSSHQHFERALEIHRRLLGEEHPDTLTSMHNVATVLKDLGRPAEAEELHGKVLEVRRRVLGREHAQTLLSMNNLAAAIRAQGRYAEAEAHHREVLEIRSRVLGAEHPDTLASMHNLASTISNQGRSAEAEELLRAVLEIRRRVLGSEHPRTLGSLQNLANSMYFQARYAEAEALYRELLEIRRRVLGPEHPHTLDGKHNLATAISDQSRNPEAEAIHREVLEARRRVLGPEHPDTLSSMHNLAGTIHEQGRAAEAEPLYREVLDIQQHVQGPEHPDTLRSMSNLALAITHQGRAAEAEPLYREVLDIQTRVLGPEHPDTLDSMTDLAGVVRAQGRCPEAEELHRKVLEIQRRVLPREHPDTLRSMHNLAAVMYDQQQYPEAEKLFREALEIMRRVLGSEHPHTLLSMNNLANSLRNQARNAEAEALYREVLETRRRVQGPKHRDTLTSMCNLALVIAHQGHFEPAEKLYREALEIWRGSAGNEDPGARAAMHNLAQVYTNWCWQLATAADVSERDPAKAVELANQAIELQPDSADHWNNLGVAQYRTGNWQAAVEAMQKADAMLEGGDRQQRMFLAMAHWQLGDKEQARQLYAQGAAWIASHAQNDEEQHRFRAEAEQLMEISEDARQQLVEQYLAHPVDGTAPAPNEQPHEQRPETDDSVPNKVQPEERGTRP